MCFYVKNYHDKPLQSKEAIKCFKFMVKRDDKVKSLIRDSSMEYSMGDVYVAEDLNGAPISRLSVKWDVDEWSFTVGPGFHSYKVPLTRCIPRGAVLVECEIPPNTPYLENKESGEYVSTKIEFIKIMSEVL